MNTYWPGLIPFIMCFSTKFPSKLTTNDSEYSVNDKICYEFYKSLSYGVYVWELPFMFEGSKFKSAVHKMSDIEYHSTLKQCGIRIKLIGLIDTSTHEVLYTPFNLIIEDKHKGIYMCNSPSIKQLLNTKNDSEKLIRESYDTLRELNIKTDPEIDKKLSNNIKAKLFGWELGKSKIKLRNLK